MRRQPYFPHPSDYDVDELRDAADNSEDDGPDPNYQCQFCSKRRYIEDYQKHTFGWCEVCASVQRHERLDDK